MFGRYAGILSAYGMALADVVYEAQEPCAKAYNPGMHVHDTVNVSVWHMYQVNVFKVGMDLNLAYSWR